jgi:CheY-like chemotaxis protein
MGQIDLENQENYFQPFNQTTRNWLNAPDGIGLGLCLSRDLARKMGGDLKFVAPIAFPIANDSPKSVISIKSKTCIELTLPYVNTLNTTLKKTHPVVSINTESNDEPFSNPKLADELVLIDDNQANLELLTLILEQLGHKNIKSFTNCLIGQKYITDNALNISHAFIDIRMPRKNGFDLISEIASVCTNTHFILLTALRHDDIRDRFTFITSRNPNIKISLLFKPIDCNELKKILTKPVKEAIPPTTQLGQKRSMRVTFI